MSTLQPYITALAQKTGLPLEMISAERFVALLDGKCLLIQETGNNDALLFYMEVGRPTLFRRGEVITELMGGNLFLAETRGAALSYDAINEKVGLNLFLPLHHLEVEAFINAVDNIVAAADEWSQKLDTLNAQAEERTRQANAFVSFEDMEPAKDTVPGASHMLRI